MLDILFPSRPRRILFSSLLVLATLPLAAGCGQSHPYSLVPITAKVTYDDGSIIPGEIVEVTFYPQAAPLNPKTYPRPATAVVSPTDGLAQKVTTITTGDGVPLGKQKVTVTSTNGAGQPTGAVPPAYADAEQTPLEIEVTAAHQHFDLQVPKPQRR
jgi:predicted small lipoprotein YifL